MGNCCYQCSKLSTSTIRLDSDCLSVMLHLILTSTIDSLVLALASEKPLILVDPCIVLYQQHKGARYDQVICCFDIWDLEVCPHSILALIRKTSLCKLV